MSEAMSSVEIEDVLSSIRRLVSEDLRPAPRPAPLPTAAPKADEKLLLTPAFRVVADRDLKPAEPALRPAALPRLHLGTGPMGDDPFGILQRAVEAQDNEWESEVGDPAPLVANMEWTEDGWAAVEDVLPAVAAPAFAAPAAAAPAFAAPAFAAAPAVRPWAQTESDAEDEAAAPAIAPADPEPAAGPNDDWADRAEAEAVAELRAADPTAADPTAAGAPLFDDLTFDEQVLRDLVRDLIREELQGALGERITRNVRKLVRAEIARAIATRDLD